MPERLVAGICEEGEVGEEEEPENSSDLAKHRVRGGINGTETTNYCINGTSRS